MGTDIHYKFQVKNEDDKWEDIDLDTSWRTADEIDNFYIPRDYQLFAVLAGVRNGVGFGGVRTGDAVVPISPPRGLPEDITDIIKRDEYDEEYYEYGDHSYSWLLGSEMLEWWKNPPKVNHVGIITIDEFLKWEIGTPWTESYCGGVWGKDVKVYDATEQHPAILKYFDFKAHEGVTHVRIKWEVSLREELDYFFEDMIKPLVEKHNEVRFVFGFDS